VFQFSIWKCIAVVKVEQVVLGGAGMVGFNSLFETPLRALCGYVAHVHLLFQFSI
jgi:hypothetical protein